MFITNKNLKYNDNDHKTIAKEFIVMEETCRDKYLAAHGWSLHRSGGECFGFSTLRQRLSTTGVWLLSRMHFRIVVRTPAKCSELNGETMSLRISRFIIPSINLKCNFSQQETDLTLTLLKIFQLWIKCVSFGFFYQNTTTNNYFYKCVQSFFTTIYDSSNYFYKIRKQTLDPSIQLKGFNCFTPIKHLILF